MSYIATEGAKNGCLSGSVAGQRVSIDNDRINGGEGGFVSFRRWLIRAAANHGARTGGSAGPVQGLTSRSPNMKSAL